MDSKALIKIKNLNVTYFKGKPNEIHSLKNINLEIFPGEFIVFFGPSGCGKSTLLYSISGLETNIEGEVYIDNQNISQLNGKELEHFHRQKIGMVFQAYYLINSLSVVKNIILPQVSNNKVSNKLRKDKALNLLKQFGLEKEAGRFPSELSGGQQQRVAISRALVNEPDLLLADEPTGNLDSKSSEGVLELFNELNENQHKTIILVTHNPANLNIAHRVFFMKDGELVGIKKNRELGEKFIRKQAPSVEIARGQLPPEAKPPVLKSFELLKESYNELDKNESTARLISFKAQEILFESLTGLTSPELNHLRQYVEKMLNSGRDYNNQMFHYLDDNIKSGGLGLNRRTARNITDKFKKIINEVKFLNRIKNKTTAVDFNSLALKARLYLEKEFRIRFRQKEQRRRFHESIRKRLENQSDYKQLRLEINQPFSRGGVGINIRKAKKISDRLELLILENYKNQK